MGHHVLAVILCLCLNFFWVINSLIVLTKPKKSGVRYFYLLRSQSLAHPVWVWGPWSWVIVLDCVLFWYSCIQLNDIGLKSKFWSRPQARKKVKKCCLVFVRETNFETRTNHKTQLFFQLFFGQNFDERFLSKFWENFSDVCKQVWVSNFFCWGKNIKKTKVRSQFHQRYMDNFFVQKSNK